MPQRDRAAVDVDAIEVGMLFANSRHQHRRRERLVDLYQVDLVEIEPRSFEHLRRRRDGGCQHQAWVGARDREVDEPGAWGEAELLRPSLAHDQNGGCAVGDCDELPAVMRPPSSSDRNARLS